MPGFVASILTPAFIAGIVSLLVSNKNEKVRASRDFITKAFDPAREDIKNAVDSAVKYFPCSFDDRSKVLEAQVLSSERGVRYSVTSVLNLHVNFDVSHLSAQDAFDNFISELTGGSFQSSDAIADVAAATRIADAGAKLKAALLVLRADALKKAIDDDPLSSLASLFLSIKKYIQRNLAPRQS